MSPSCSRACRATRRLAWLAWLPPLACGPARDTPQHPAPGFAERAGSCYLILIPAESTGVADWPAAKQRFEKLLLDEAGGFTELGRCRGTWRHDGRVLTEDNIAYFVVGPPSLAERARELISTRFQQRQPFVVAW